MAWEDVKGSLTLMKSETAYYSSRGIDSCWAQVYPCFSSAFFSKRRSFVGLPFFLSKTAATDFSIKYSNSTFQICAIKCFLSFKLCVGMRMMIQGFLLEDLLFCHSLSNSRKQISLHSNRWRWKAPELQLFSPLWFEKIKSSCPAHCLENATRACLNQHWHTVCSVRKRYWVNKDLNTGSTTVTKFFKCVQLSLHHILQLELI